MPIPPFTPAAPTNVRDTFDHDDYVFELKMDRFRALAQVGPDETRLVSGRGNVYNRFNELGAAIHIELDCEAVFDGEIVCLDTNGRPQFYDLLRHRGAPVFYAFDLLWLDGEDLRARPLIERKRLLRSIVPGQPSAMLYAEPLSARTLRRFPTHSTRMLATARRAKTPSPPRRTAFPGTTPVSRNAGGRDHLRSAAP